MAPSLSSIILNPVRMRIIQCMASQSTSTAKQLGEKLSDVPKASLYRHLKKLVDAQLLVVVQENKVRGTMEKVYALNPNPPSFSKTNAAIQKEASYFLMHLLHDFRQYLLDENNNAERDMLFLKSATLLLSDQEFADFLEEVGRAYAKVMQNAPSPERKVRQISFISSPKG